MEIWWGLHSWILNILMKNKIRIKLMKTYTVTAMHGTFAVLNLYLCKYVKIYVKISMWNGECIMWRREKKKKTSPAYRTRIRFSKTGECVVFCNYQNVLGLSNHRVCDQIYQQFFNCGHYLLTILTVISNLNES